MPSPTKENRRHSFRIRRSEGISSTCRSTCGRTCFITRPAWVFCPMPSSYTCTFPGAVSGELRAKLAGHFTPQEVMEIVLVIGFWKMYNVMHNAMDLPIEDPVAGYTKWVNYGKQPAERAE